MQQQLHDRAGAIAASAARAPVHDRQSRHAAAARAAPSATICRPTATQLTSALAGRRRLSRARRPMCAARRSTPMRCCRRAAGGAVAGRSAADLAARQSVALRQALAQEALANSSNRFAAIQSLIAAISTAHAIRKAILDLQARISAELGMLQNEQTKLQVLSQASEAQDCGERAARARAGDRRAGPIRDPLPAGAVDHGAHGILRHILGWLNGQLATYIGNNTARLARCSSRGGDAGDALRDGVGLPAPHRPDRGAVRRRAEAHHHAGRDSGRRAASLALQHRHRRYLLQRARAARGRRGRRRRPGRHDRCHLGERRHGRRQSLDQGHAFDGGFGFYMRAPWSGA